jgi:ComF family protein
MMFASPPSSVNQKPAPRSTIGRLLGACGAFLVPPACVLCDAPGMAGPLDLCAACLAGLPRIAPGDAFESRAFSRICCPWRFEFPIDELVRALKFRGERTYARLFGTLLARERSQIGPDAEAAPLPHRVVPVPLHPRRLRERGYNQAAELARFAARSLALPLDLTLLQRSRATQGQTGLRVRERTLNVAGAFVTTRTLHHAPRLALVDDVVTTGGTVLAAAAALQAAGAGAVELWVVARARRLSRSLGTNDIPREAGD